jgi:hypothetical protein
MLCYILDAQLFLCPLHVTYTFKENTQPVSECGHAGCTDAYLTEKAPSGNSDVTHSFTPRVLYKAGLLQGHMFNSQGDEQVY